jgi:hypothetical protein
MQAPNETAAAILVQTLVGYSDKIQRTIRNTEAEPHLLAPIIVALYKEILEQITIEVFEPRAVRG